MKNKSILAVLIICIIIPFSIVTFVNGNNMKNDNKKVEVQDNNENLDNSTTELSLEEEAKKFNFELKDTNKDVKLSKEDALSKAKEYYPGYFNNAKDVKVVLKDYENTAKKYVPNGENVIPEIENATCWIVTLKDVTLRNYSKRETATASKANFNIIIDANSGNDLGAFAYKESGSTK